jgi:hypothetical protein
MIDACGECLSCKDFESGSNPDFNRVYKELSEFTEKGKGKKAPLKFPVDVVREFLTAPASRKPSISKRKVFVIDEAEKLSIGAQNALLKILEEPPDYCFIILICTRMDRLLETTKSRCQIVPFGAIEEEHILGYFSGSSLSSDILRYFSRFTEGSLGQTLQLEKLETEGAELFSTKRRLVKAVSKLRYDQSRLVAEKLCDESKKLASFWSEIEADISKKDISRRADGIFMRMIISAVRDAMVLVSSQEPVLINADQREDIRVITERFAPQTAAEKITQMYGNMQWIDNFVNQKLNFEHLLLNLTNSDKIQV